MNLPPPRRWIDEPLRFDQNGDPILIPDIVQPPPMPWKGGKLQELLYLDPLPDGQPIINKPTRQQRFQTLPSQFTEPQHGGLN